MDKQYFSKKDLYNLFTKTDLVDSEFIASSKKIYQTKNNLLNASYLSPMSKLIYESVPDDDKERILKDLILDNEYIDKLDENDPDYIDKLQNNKLGLYMEDFVCHYIKCPVCHEKTLRKFKIKNMPVIDVVCINTEHHNKFLDTKFFQIKISVDNNYYFNQKYILVGSKKYGFNCHEIYGSDNILNKQTLIGYICLSLNEVKDNIYKISEKKSFILIPNISNHNSEKYYEYINYPNRFNHNVITWNKNLVYQISLKNLIDSWMVDTNSIFYDASIIKNPYNQKSIKKRLDFNQLAGYKYKYIKYKLKYLRLKSNHINPN